MMGADKLSQALLRRGAALAARRKERRKTMLAEGYAAALPGVVVSQTPSGVLLRGRRLLARMLRDPVARWPGGWLS